MKIIKLNTGHIVAIGFDVMERVEAPDQISWSDTDGTTWEPDGTNCAGYAEWRGAGDVKFVHVTPDGFIAHADGRCLIAKYVGSPLVFSFQTLLPEA